uniref:uncharacterized protein LOC122588385 n=1 Tax=Erigeron canadensis TaxID=72917 RepID=UPI001CB9A37A|nr:uncharacterized protein LOC122588385 [Erigeron canadensis]
MAGVQRASAARDARWARAWLSEFHSRSGLGTTGTKGTHYSPSNPLLNEEELLDSDTETEEEEDPSFDIIHQHTESKFSKLSINRSRCSVPSNCIIGTTNNQQQNSFEFVESIIQAGQVEKLKVAQCDACTGDIVMFEQNVYETFNVASRSATGPPCGTRVVSGRIVKESYGAAKQQHTFTIEVLWSKGEKPLPPLHPLLIKGRNLYRLKTMRQRWEDESQRRKILSEKHSRGDAARLNREARLQEKEKKKALRENRASNGNIQKDEKKTATSLIHTMISSENPRKPDLQNISIQQGGAPCKGDLGNCSLKSNTHNNHGGTYKENIIPNDLGSPVRREPHSPFKRSFQVEQNINYNDFRSPVRREPHSPVRKNFQVEQNIVPAGFRSPVRREPPRPIRRSFQVKQNIIPNDVRSPVRGYPRSPFRRSFLVEQAIIPNDLRNPVRGEPHSPFRKSFQAEQSTHFYPSREFGRHEYDHRANTYLTRNPRESYNFHQGNNHHHTPTGGYQGQRQQLCRYYTQGRCHYGTNCKYLH